MICDLLIVTCIANSVCLTCRDTFQVETQQQRRQSKCVSFSNECEEKCAHENKKRCGAIQTHTHARDTATNNFSHLLFSFPSHFLLISCACVWRLSDWQQWLLLVVVALAVLIFIQTLNWIRKHIFIYENSTLKCTCTELNWGVRIIIIRTAICVMMWCCVVVCVCALAENLAFHCGNGL